MTREDLTQIEGLTKEQIDAVMRLAGLDVQAAKAREDNLNAQLTTLQTQLQTAQEGLKAFEGVDVQDLRGKVTQLTNQLKEQAATFAFESLLRRLAREAGAENEDDVLALLPNRKVLEASTNQETDSRAALAALKEAKPYLFKAQTQTPDEPEQPDTRTPIVTPKPRSPKNTDPTVQDFVDMSGIQRMELRAKNPALFQALMQELAAHNH